MSGKSGKNGHGASWKKGQEIVEGLQELASTLESGEPLEARFTVRTFRIARPPEYGGEGVRRVRDLLSMSQAAFSAFLGVDVSTVRSWEQGLRSPGPMACRMLSEIEAEPAHWRKRLAGCLAESKSADTPAPPRGRARNSIKAS